jgi:hypothetical protein
MSPSKDRLPMSASERLIETARRAGLHPVTWVIIAAASAHFVADVVSAIHTIHSFLETGSTPGGTRTDAGQVAASIVHNLAYSTLFIGSAATVEFLARIWAELSALRTKARD